MKSQNKLALGVITSLTALGGFSLVAQQTRSPVRPVSNEITSESKRPASTSDQRRPVQRQRQGQVHDLGTVNVEVDRSQQDSRTQSATRSTSGTTATTAAASQATEPRENISVIPLREETVQVSKRVVNDGTVRIRKVVETETVNQPVELRRETLILERVAEGEGQSGQAIAGMPGPFEEGVIELTVSREVPVVDKQVGITGHVVARTQVDTDRQQVEETVRRESVEVVEGGNSPRVEIRGDIARAPSRDDPSGERVAANAPGSR